MQRKRKNILNEYVGYQGKKIVKKCLCGYQSINCCSSPPCSPSTPDPVAEDSSAGTESKSKARRDQKRHEERREEDKANRR